jgi:hypothetical protein
MLKLLERKSLTDRGRQPQSAGKIPTIDPPIEREPQFAIIAPVFKDPSIRAYWGDVESTLPRFIVDDLIAVSCDYYHALHCPAGYNWRRESLNAILV